MAQTARVYHGFVEHAEEILGKKGRRRERKQERKAWNPIGPRPCILGAKGCEPLLALLSLMFQFERSRGDIAHFGWAIILDRTREHEAGVDRPEVAVGFEILEGFAF